MARKLHEDAGVPLGPCGRKALEKFQAYLSPDYQFKVMATSFPSMVTYQGPPAPFIIRLLQFEDHYHGCWSYMGFLERSYFCDENKKNVVPNAVTMRRVYNIIEPTTFARNSNDAPSVARNSIQPI